jgi:hypothetical protein
MTWQQLHSEFPYIRGNFNFIFYQCGKRMREGMGKERRKLRARIFKRLRSPGIDSYIFGLRIHLGRGDREEDK